MASAPQVEEKVQQAAFVFVATVMKLGAATVPNFEVKASTAVVRVNQTLHTPQVVGSLTGKEITVQLSNPQAVKVRDEAIFFARGLVYAESIAVEEVAPPQLVAGTSRTEHIGRVTEAVGRLPDLHVRAHAADADLVIVGKVTSIKLVPAPVGGPVTHHDPGWQEAVVEVESVEAGSLNQKTISLLFPASEDVKWHRAPKFQVGDEGVFLLHRHQVEELKRESLAVLDPMDFHPRSRVEGIRAALKKNPG